MKASYNDEHRHGKKNNFLGFIVHAGLGGGQCPDAADTSNHLTKMQII